MGEDEQFSRPEVGSIDIQKIRVNQPRFSAFKSHPSQQDQEDATTYWETALSNCQASPFPPVPSTIQQPIPDTVIEIQCPPFFGASSDIVISTFVRAAWAIVTSRYTNSDDVVFGATGAGRNVPVPEIGDIVGPTIATVPVRVRVVEDQPVSVFLEIVQQQAAEMTTYEQIGLQGIAKIGPDAERACEFQTLLVVQPATTATKSNEVSGERQSRLENFSTYCLILQCILADEGVRITASFDKRAMEKWQVEKMLGQFNFVMRQLARAHSGTKIIDIDILTPEDKQKLREWNCEGPPAVERCIHDLFAEQARARPNGLAIYAWDGELTYSKLEELSSKLAGRLIGLGVKAEDVVPLCFEKSMWTIVAMLAVLKAGGAFLLLDPTIPIERLRLMCGKVSSTLALASRACVPTMERLVKAVVAVDRGILELPQLTYLSTGTRPTSTAYIIFTSGSTGGPKGCRIEHRSSCSALSSQGRKMGINTRTRALQFGSYNFAGSLVEILLSLSHGACICIPSEEERRSGLPAAISKMNVNWAFLTPTALDSISDPQSVPSLATLCMGGEPIRASQIQQWESKVHLRQVYGSSETSGVISSVRLTNSSLIGDVGRVSMGAYWIVQPNDHTKLAPLGAIGELLVESPALGREYIDEPEKTKATFVEAPPWRMSFGGDQRRLYKTGDLAKYKDDGSIELLGRKDTQVKLRGQRIELGEIEHQALLAESGAKEIVVELIKPREGSSTLACFLTFETSSPTLARGNCDETDLSHRRHAAIGGIQERLEQFLPQYMVPTVFIPLERLPITSSKKVDRKRLREIGASFSTLQLAEMRLTSHAQNRPPSTEAEKMIQQLWARVLNINPENIGADDSFFRLGGDSITALKFVAEACKEGIPLVIADIIKNPRLADLADLAIRSAHIIPSTIPPSDPPSTKIQPTPKLKVDSAPLIDWDAETSPPRLRIVPEFMNNPTPKAKPEVVVLTGCSGLLGHHLLNALLATPSIRRVICLAVRRLSQRLRSQQLPLPSSRVVYYEGDLTQPRLGLSEDKWTKIFSQADAVIHNGADTTNLKYYSALREVNVEATRELLRACLHRMVPIHYVSSSGVAIFEGLSVYSQMPCTKISGTPPTDGTQGYLCSKWVCEGMLERAHSEYGLRVVIHRPSSIICEGEDMTAERAQQDIINALLYYSHKTQRVPRIQNNSGVFNLISVERCCNDAIRELLRDTPYDKAVTYVNNVSDTVIPMMQIANIGLEKLGKPYKVLPMEEWTKMAVAAGMHPVVAALIGRIDQR